MNTQPLLQQRYQIGKEAVPWFRKHALWLVPSTIFCVVSTDIIINPDHRETLEKYMPDYGTDKLLD